MESVGTLNFVVVFFFFFLFVLYLSTQKENLECI